MEVIPGPHLSCCHVRPLCLRKRTLVSGRWGGRVTSPPPTPVPTTRGHHVWLLPSMRDGRRWVGARGLAVLEMSKSRWGTLYNLELRATSPSVLERRHKLDCSLLGPN